MTPTKLKIASNTIYQIIGRLSTAFSTLIITAIITRYLGVTSFGEYSIVIAYLTIFYTISDFGVNAVLIREFAHSKEYAKENFRKVLTFRIFFGLFLMLIAGLVVLTLPYSDLVKKAIFIGLPLLIFNSISKAAAVIFQSYLEYKYQAIAMSIGSLFSVLAVGLAVFSPFQSLSLIIGATVFSSAIAPAISLYYSRSYIITSSKYVDYAYWKEVLLDSLPFGISLILNTFMIQIDRLLLSVMSSAESVGIYSLSYRIFELVLILPTFIMNSTYPVLVLLNRSSSDKYKKSVGKLIKFMSLTSILVTLIVVSFSNIVIPVIWGSEMIGSASSLNILMFGSIFFFISAPLSWMILVEGKDKVLPYIYGFGFLLNLFLNIIFIPKYDYIGAAWVTIFTEALIVLLLMFSFHSYLKKRV